MKKYVLIAIGLILASGIFISCDKLKDIVNSGLSEDEIVKGLKTALQVGTDSSVAITSATNGYFKDEAIKILLPPEASTITNAMNNSTFKSISSTLGLDFNKMINDVVLSMNRAAESAAKQATPIFKTAITNLSISDGLSILKGTNPASGTKSTSTSFDSTAATHYLASTTKDTLVGLYKIPIDKELNKDLGVGISANEAWTTLTGAYNNVADNSFGFIDPIQQTSLGGYVTGKALDGLFYKVGQQEVSIRRNPWKWISNVANDVGDVLQKVFGSKN